MMRRFIYFSLLGLLACSAVGPETVTKADYGDDWPFPDYDSAILKCTNKTFGGVKRPLVTVTLGDTEYGLNGAAMGVGKYPDARKLMGRDQWGAYVSDAGLIERALVQCQ